MKIINYCYKLFIKKLKKIYTKNEINKLFFILFSYILKCNIKDIYYYFLIKKRIKKKKYIFFLESLLKLKYKYPIQYIIKYTFFYNVKILLNNNIFIPRQDTEELVKIIIKDNKNKKKIKILDICSGSGCISIVLKKKLNCSYIYCLDYSHKILLNSKKNFKYNNIQNCIFFLKINLLKKKKKYKKIFNKLPKLDLIISNPPYINYKYYNNYINTNIIYEPYNSIFVINKDPIIFYKIIMSLFYKKLKKNGIIYFEISNKIKKKLYIYFKKKYSKNKIIIKKDINNNYLILKIIKKQ